jgi:Virulence-associated protein E-like domain
MAKLSQSRPAPANAALELKRHGIQPVLLKPNDKVPVHTGWQKQQLSEANIPTLFTNAHNVGVQYGPVSGGLVDAEFDSESARVLAPRFMPPTRTVFGRPSKPCSHWLYRCPELHDGQHGASRFPDLTKDGAPNPKSRFNVMVALELLGIECRYDLFSLRYVVSGHPLAEFVGELSDPMLFRLAELVFERFRLSPAIGVVMEAVQTLANHHRFHPVRDYLDGLEWDGTPRIDSWLASYGGAGDTPYTRAAGALTLIAAVRRVREPGCKFDETLVLEGPEGINKSEALRVLAVKSEWFSDSLSFNLKPQEAIEQTTGVWIVEIPELRGLRRSDFDKRKAFQSRREDRARLAYGHTSTRAPRQYVPIATTNEKQYLEDLTGNRRFWPVGVEGFDLEALARDRDQLWAEAASREANGDSIRLPEHLWPEAAEQQQDRMVDNPFVMLLDQTLRGMDDMKDGEWVEGKPMQGKIALEDVWTILDIRPGQRTQKHNNDLGAAMKELGWEKKKLRVGGGRERGPRPTHYVRGPQPWRSIVVDPRMIIEGQVIPTTARYAASKPAF